MKVVVVGCGSMGLHLALAMSREGHDVSVIDSDPSARIRLGPEFRGRFINGVAIDLNTLVQAGIETSDGLAAVTDDDNTNLAVAIVAKKRFRVPLVAARVVDPSKMVAYRAASIHMVCPPAWGFRAMIDILLHQARDVALSLGHGEVEVVAVSIGPSGKHLHVCDLTATPGIIPIALVRNGTAFVPSSTAGLSPGDVIFLRVPETEKKVLDEMLRSLEG